MSSGVLLRHEVGDRQALVLQADGNAIRRRAMTVRNAEDAKDVARINDEKRYHVKGRVVATGRVVFDVFRVLNDGSLQLCGADFAFFEEAAYFAADLLAGKTRVAMSGLSSVHMGKTRSGLFVPTRPTAGPKQSVKVTRLPDGSAVFRK